MHNNYYFLRQLTAALGKLLEDTVVATCFSQQKNELILGFSRPGFGIYIKATLHPDFCCLSFHDEFHRTKRNSVNIFSPVLDKKLKSVYQAINERSFVIHLEDDISILFKMHGNRSNIVLFQNGELISLFKNNLVKDKKLTLEHLDRKLDQGWQHFEETGGNHALLFPTFGKVLKDYLARQHYEKMSLKEQWQMIQSLLEKLSSPTYYIINDQGKITFSLVKTGQVLDSFRDPIQAITQFYYTYIKINQLEKEKSAVLKTLENSKKKTENYIQKTQSKLNIIRDSRKNEEIANIIMANLHQIPANLSEVTLYDFYHDQEINIKLKKGLTPQKNAENYYRKAKNQKLEVEALDNNLKIRKQDLNSLITRIEALKNADDIKTVRKMAGKEAHTAEATSRQKSLPYKKFNFMNYDILVGKSAAGNDILTQKIASKDDLWLHARDVSGSHVVVKNLPGKQFPGELIEKAAELAAFYSKRKNDSLCPVIYTLKKYVRKPKSLAPGKVKVEKEKVILVEPKNFG